jgi:hypothetical protein
MKKGKMSYKKGGNSVKTGVAKKSPSMKPSYGKKRR